MPRYGFVAKAQIFDLYTVCKDFLEPISSGFWHVGNVEN